MKSFLLGVSLLLTGCCALVACSSPTSSPAAIRIRWPSDPHTLDPLVVNTPQALEVINLLHCSLLTGDPTLRQRVPWLAESLPRVRRRDSLTLLTYRIRSEATWDNGRPVLAHDVAFTLRVLNCPGLPTEYARAQYGHIRNIELDTADARQFTLVCSSGSPDMVFASGDYSILPEHALDPAGELRTVPLPVLRTDTALIRQQYPAVRAFAARYRLAQLARNPGRLPGCGPYTLVGWQHNQYVQLRRKPHWWADRLPNRPSWLQARAAQLEFRIIPDHTTALLALRRNELDVYPMPPARIFNQARHSTDTSRFVFSTADSYDLTMAGFNTQNPLLADAATRRALSLLFDVPHLIQATQPGLAYRSASVVSPRDERAYNDSLPLPGFSPRQAARQLERAGWRRRPDGSWWQGTVGPLALSISYRTEAAEHETAALQFRAAAAGIGIPVRLRPTEAGLLQQQLAAGNIDMFIRTLSGNPFAYNFTPILHSQGIGLFNFTRFSLPAADHLIEAITATSMPARHTLLLRRFQRLLQQQTPLVVLYFTRNRLIASRRLQGARAISIRPGYDVLRLALTPPGR